MRILIVEDSEISAIMLQEILTAAGYTTMIAKNGVEAWDMLQKHELPLIVILDWMMPEMNGLDLCREIRSDPRLSGLYIIMLSVLNSKAEIAEGLEAGANDYVVKPFSHLELKARVAVGVRVATLEKERADHVDKLEKALVEVKQLKQFLPICAYCKKIRDDDNYWQQIEHYIISHLDTRFTHGICPDCYAKIFNSKSAGENQGAMASHTL